MNEHAGPACALSALIVGVFAILLHEKTPTPTPPGPPVRQVAPPSHVEARGPEASVSKGRPPVAVVETLLVATLPGTAEVATRSGPPASRPADPPLDLSGPPKSPLRRPSAGFAIVGSGESLQDVAIRVYGSTEATESLWKANRDQADRMDSKLAPGTLLRTP